MRSYQRYIFWIAALAMVAWTAPRAFVFAEDTPPLKLVKTIELTDIKSGEPDVSSDQLAKTYCVPAPPACVPVVAMVWLDPTVH